MFEQNKAIARSVVEEAFNRGPGYIGSLLFTSFR